MSKKMLIVDDDEMIRMCISKYCKEAGITSESVEKGAEALEKLKSNSYDAMIVDLNLDDMNGEEVLTKAKGCKYGKTILMSGTPDVDFKSKGFDFYLEKPIKKDAFTGLLGQI